MRACIHRADGKSTKLRTLSGKALRFIVLQFKKTSYEHNILVGNVTGNLLAEWRILDFLMPAPPLQLGIRIARTTSIFCPKEQVPWMAKLARIAAVMMLTIIVVAVLTAIGSRTNSNDYIEYWSAGKLFVQGANPYSEPLILALEKSRGLTPDAPLVMLNPPWALFMVAPLGFFPALPALVLWVLATVGSVLASILALKVPPQYRTLAFLFAPVLTTFTMEQSSPFLLLGFCLFLRLHQQRPFLAGASLLLMSIKPHLFLVFWAVLLVDCLYRHRFAILAGLASALACASVFATLVSPHVWLNYFALTHKVALDQHSFISLPILFQSLIGPKIKWLALVPACVAIVWGLAYYWAKRAVWEWKRHGMPVMMVTILTSPYGWISDEVVLLPSVIFAALSSPRRFSLEILTVLNCAALLVFWTTAQGRSWLPLAWFAWYLYAVRMEGNTPSEKNDSAPKVAEAATSTFS